MGERLYKKVDRLNELKQLLLEHRLTKADIARRLSVHRSTAAEYIDDLSAQGIPVLEEDDYFFIDRDLYKVKVEFTQHEGMALHLAARLLTSGTDKFNPHAASALRKLGEATQGFAPLFSQHLQLSADVLDGDSRRRDSIFLQALETLTRAWTLGRKVSLMHQMEDGKEYSYTFAPYFIEPYAAGRTVHVIGWREPPARIMTFKIERIRTIRLLEESYTIPPDFDPREQLKDAWGIWYTERKPEQVVLRFNRQVAARVKETQWHHSERTKIDEHDGSLIWEAEIGEWQEMLPWIRGWGADVEVLEPKELKRLIALEAKATAQLYNVMENKPMPAYMRLWAKADRETYHLHRLIYHMLDVGAVAQALWDEALPDSLKTFIAETCCGVDKVEAGRLVAFWAALHDLGKASTIFQWHPRLSESLRRVILSELRAANIPVPQWHSNATTRHEIITTWALIQQRPNGLLSETGIDPSWAYKIATTLGGHHGEFPKDGATEADQLLPDQRGGAEWDALRTELFRALHQIFSPPTPRFNDALLQEQENQLLALLAAFISIADWIGSDEEFFPYEEDAVNLDRYAARSSALARCAVAAVGWTQELATLDDADFERLFKRAPRPIQQVVIDVANGLDAPALVILEAPTGIGKTEAALYLADQWSQRKEAQGLYVAMPTMATSNQMHERVTDFVQTRYGVDVQTLLVHSQAELKRREARNETRDAFEDSEKQQDRVTALTWFLPRKRSLLAPFGVGTVDQSLMSILQTKHFFVRLFGLYRKVVIFDEVHAYDIYMTELFKLLLKWLRALDASVIILSATLPDKTRRELVKAYAGRSNLPLTEYPRLTIARGDGSAQVVPLPKPEKPRHLALDWVERAPIAMAARLKQELGDKGCAAVICNTVERAQEVYEAIVTANPDCDLNNIILFHARTPRIWRNAKEESVLKQFGPPEKSKRPAGKSIVIATQVIEQSLDLDFDVMISDLAPMDFLIQRAGRLQRHDRGERQYPDCLLLACSLKSDGLPDFEKDVYIYHRYTLLATYFVLRNRNELELPDDTPTLIEQVYGEDEIKDLSDAERTELTTAREKLEKDDDKEKLDARAKLVKPPEDYRFIYGTETDLDEDDPSLHKVYRALTRNDDPGLSLICLHRTPRGLALEPEDDSPVFDEAAELSPEQVTEILQGVVNVRKHVVVDHFLATDLPKKWRKSHALRYHRLAIFENSVYDKIPELQLRLDEKLGLQYIARKEAK